jgi:photosystem II stability/assembly factor-like uncharacterized protein
LVLSNKLWRIVWAALCLSGVCAASEWRSTGPWGGSATSIWVDGNAPDTLLAGARNSLVYRSVNGGSNWTRLPFPKHFSGNVTAVAIHPADAQLYLAGVELPQSHYAGAWYSENAGRTWKMGAGLEGISVQALTFWLKDPRIVAAATKDGVWLSADSGRTWKRISAPYNHELRSVTAVAIDPQNTDIIYAGTTHLPWKTTDGGKSWHSIQDGMLDDSDVFSIFIDPAKPSRVLASACSGIYRSEDGGTAWTKFKGIPPEQRRTHVVRQHPQKPEIIYAGTTLGLLKSVNGGATFRRINSLHILSMVFDPRNSQRIYMATEGAGLWKSEDGGETLVPINEGFVNRRVVSLTSAGTALYANVVQDGASGGIFSSSDGGLNWKLASSAAVLRDNHITKIAGCASRSEFLLAGNETRALRTLDAGKTWREVNLGLKAGGRLLAIACTSPPAGGKDSWLAGTDQGLLRSHDFGATWQAVRLTTANIRHSVADIYTSAANPRRVVVKTTQSMYLSEDGGTIWKVLNILFPVNQINDIALAGSGGGSYLVATSQGLYASEDAGRSWKKLENGLQPGTVSTLAVRPGRESEVYAAQFGSVYVSGSQGRTWKLVPRAEMMEATLRRLAFHDRDGSRILALTPDMGIFYLDLRLEQ